MNVEEGLFGVTRLYVDTAPFIYFTEAHAGYSDKMKAVFHAVSTGKFMVITSAVTLSETLVKPLQADDTALLNRYRNMFYNTNGIRVVSVHP